jgi:hypothetical protein
MECFCGLKIGVKYYNGNIQAVQRGSVKELQQFIPKIVFLARYGFGV